MGSRRGEVSRRVSRSEQGDPDGSPFFFASRERRRSADVVACDGARTAVGARFAALAAAGALAWAAAWADTGADASAHANANERAAPAAVVVLAAPDLSRLRALDCVDGRETASFPLPSTITSIAIAPKGDAVFVGVGERLARLQLPALTSAARETLALDAHSLVAAGGTDAVVLAAGSGETPLSARDPETLASLHEYRLDNGRRASVSSIVDRPRRSRIVVAFADLDEIWEIDYRRNAPPVLRGLVHDYRMREAVELPGRFTPRTFAVPGATRALVAGSAPHEVLRIDASGALGVLNLDVRREIERPPVDAVPAPERIAAWQGESSRGWVLADEAATALRVLDARTWKLAAPLPVEGEVLALAPMDNGAVLLALDRGGRIALASVEVEARRMRELSAAAQTGQPPYRLVRGVGGCIALVDAQNRWIAGLMNIKPETRAAAPGQGS
ncbi:MAG: hypothetical protein ROZ64_04630 [Burkholderiaceae bacterium]|nr:hypothetical protein [Burkholderiaceae bacterium]